MKKTPMELQYDAIKNNHQDKILLFRLGDFYEVFNDDALEAANILNIALTKRNEKPMCGFPHHALEQYAYKLVDAGYKVAICEQVEDVSVAKGIVKRDVVSVLTKGTWSENPLLDRSINSFLAIIVYIDQEISILFADISTGDIIIRSQKTHNPTTFLADEMMRYTPVETLCMYDFFHDFNIEEELKVFQETLRVLPQNYFHETELYRFYQNQYPEFNKHISLSIKKTLQALFCYLEENHFSEESIKHLQQPIIFDEQDFLFMNEDTLRHLELVINNKDFSSKGTLFSVLNQTKTMPAARKLRRLLTTPSANTNEILKQQARTEYFINITGNTVSDMLKGISDLERLAARLITGKILPRECLALAESVQKSELIKNFLINSKPFHDYFAMMFPLMDLVELINQHISQEASNMIDGNVILSGINQELDEYRSILQNGKDFLITLQTEERINTGINTLKVAYNKIYGYYIEVSKGSIQKVPSHYIRKQSLVNAERYTIPILDEFEHKIVNAENTVIRLEREIYEKLVLDIQQFYSKLIALTEFITEVDLRNSLSQVAKEYRYQKPNITDTFEWNIKDGRHPVIEQLLKKDQFISNDTHFNVQELRIAVITGPNMAGKSTYLRQNALFSVMAQIGSYLPVSQATIGVVDQIFTRIGASDDLGSGRSTFFVEMQEAALIIDKMTPKSLVIMDELGRGTSTSDGLSLSWAILEYLLLNPQKKGKVLFSTHYHELTELGKFKGIQNFCMSVKENNNKPIFLRKVVSGKASKSYGIHVAEMAGVESSIIKRATDILAQLDKGTFFKTKIEVTENQNLFTPKTELENPLKKYLETIDPNTLTPLEALRLFYEIKQIAQDL